MFKLKKILGGRTNVGEYRTITVNPTPSAIKAGTPISIYSSNVRIMSPDVDFLATHIVEADAEDKATTLYVLDLLPGMVFSADFEGEPSDYEVYQGYYISKGKMLTESTDGSKCGAVVYEKPKDGDKEILVTFPCAY